MQNEQVTGQAGADAMVQVKRRFSEAAAAALAGDPAAPELARIALEDLQRVRTAAASHADGATPEVK